MQADLGSVPGALQTLLAFAAFVVPGFLLRAGYVRSVARSKAQADLHVLAEAVVGSLLVLAVAWWWRGHDVLNWVQTGTLSHHERKAYWFFAVLLITPYFVGTVLGWGVNILRSQVERRRPPVTKDWRSLHRRVYFYLDSAAIFALPTIWDQAWDALIARAPLIVRVRTTTGNEVVGSYSFGAWVGLSPDPYDLYLRHVYREKDGEWEPIPNSEGILFRESAIESVEFLFARESATPDPKRGSSGNRRVAAESQS